MYYMYILILVMDVHLKNSMYMEEEIICLMIPEKASWEKVCVRLFVLLHKFGYDIAGKWRLERHLEQRNNLSDAAEILWFGFIS